MNNEIWIKENVTQTPIEIALGIDEEGRTTARKLYSFLELASTQFARWAKKNIEENEFFDENIDWWGFDIVSNGNECKDYRITTEFAKHLAMESHTKKGKIAKDYFITVENKAVEMTKIIKSQLPQTHEEKLLFMMECQAEVYERVNAVEEKQKEQTRNIDDIYEKIDYIENKSPVNLLEAEKVNRAVKSVAIDILGGKDSLAYRDRKLSKKLYKDIYRQLYREYDIKSYKELHRDQVEQALGIISSYKCPLVLMENITNANSQLRLV